MEKFAALKKAKKEEPYLPDGYWRETNPRCPHCGESCSVVDNELWDLYEEGEHEITCPHCDGDFTVSTHVSYSFCTENQEEDDDA